MGGVAVVFGIGVEEERIPIFREGDCPADGVLDVKGGIGIGAGPVCGSEPVHVAVGIVGGVDFVFVVGGYGPFAVGEVAGVVAPSQDVPGVFDSVGKDCTGAGGNGGQESGSGERRCGEQER